MTVDPRITSNEWKHHRWRFARGAPPSGDVVLLYGELGRRKTAFVRGLARGLVACPQDVSSPTFTLIQNTPAPVPRCTTSISIVSSFRKSRISGSKRSSRRRIVAIEWADRWAGRPDDVCEVWIEDAGDDRREIRVLRRENAEIRHRA